MHDWNGQKPASQLRFDCTIFAPKFPDEADPMRLGQPWILSILDFVKVQLIREL